MIVGGIIETMQLKKETLIWLVGYLLYCILGFTNMCYVLLTESKVYACLYLHASCSVPTTLKGV